MHNKLRDAADSHTQRPHLHGWKFPFLNTDLALVEMDPNHRSVHGSRQGDGLAPHSSRFHRHAISGQHRCGVDALPTIRFTFLTVRDRSCCLLFTVRASARVTKVSYEQLLFTVLN